MDVLNSPRPEQSPRQVGKPRDESGIAPNVLLPMSRRERIKTQWKADSAPPQVRDVNELTPVGLRVFYRFFLWSIRIDEFILIALWDVLRFRSNQEQRAIRFRNMFQRMGGTAIKIGQLLSARVDIIPNRIGKELENLTDEMRPIAIGQALEMIESAIGGAIEDVFKVVDPTPIAISSIDCIYQAELKSGEKVAIKVLRPHVGRKIFSDLKAITMLMTVGEELGLIQPNLTKTFRREISRHLMEELDLSYEARRMEIFRLDSRKSKFVSAPAVYHHLSNHQVLVTEFIVGAFLGELIAAVEQQDQTAIDRYERRGFDFEKIGKRIQQIFFWEIFESHFFHTYPDPLNVIVGENNTIIFKDFESCIPMSNRIRRDLLMFYRSLMIDGDLDSVTDSMISLLEPLPPIDTDEFFNDLLDVVRDSFHAQKSRYSAWQQKSSGTIWSKMLELARINHCQGRSDLVRFCHASYLYDSISFRINPKLNPYQEFKKWYARYARKTRMKLTGEAIKRIGGPLDTDYVEFEDRLKLALQYQQRLQHHLNQPSYNYAFGVNKMAYVASTLTKGSINVFVLFVACIIFRTFYLDYIGAAPEIRGAAFAYQNFIWVVNQPILQFIIFIYSLVVMRKIIYRLDDVDVERD